MSSQDSASLPGQNEISQMTGSPTDSAQKRRRISKACDYCRKKKIKCDGLSPCKSCVNYNISCSYTYVEKKRAPSKRNSNSKTIMELETRLGKMESLMELLVEKLDCDSTNGPSSSSNYDINSNTKSGANSEVAQAFKDQKYEGYINDNSSMDINSNVSNEESDSTTSDEDYDSDEMFPEQSLGLNDSVVHSDSKTMKVTSSILKSPTVSKNSLNSDSESAEIYFGAHSSFSIFSPRGLRWIQSKLGDNKHLLDPFREVHIKMHNFQISSLQKWTEPIDKRLLNPLPNDKIVKHLFEIFIQLTDPNFIYDEDDSKELLNIFFTKKTLSYSEHLAINAILALSSSFKSDVSVLAHEDLYFATSSMDLSLKELSLIEDNCLMNAIFYYHRVSVISDGLKAIQAILLLSCYIESTLLTHSNYMLISTAIRLAQELGLHRKESYNGLSQSESDKRKRIWWQCYMLDKDNCLRSGKPPIINDSDVSTLPQTFVYNVLNSKSTIKVKFNNLGVNEVLYDLARKEGFYVYTMIYSQQMSKISALTYEELFSANALVGKKPKEILEVIENLNKVLFQFKESIDFNLRPGNNVDLGAYSDILKVTESRKLCVTYHILFLHYNYYILLMIINRFTSKLPWFVHDANFQRENFKKKKSFDNICLDSARQIIQTFQKANKKYSHFANWTMFYPFSAFITIFSYCIESPTENQSINDIHLLIDVGTKLLKDSRKENLGLLPHTLKWDFMDIVVKQSLKIAVNVLETNTNYVFRSDELKKYFDSDESYLRFKRTKIPIPNASMGHIIQPPQPPQPAEAFKGSNYATQDRNQNPNHALNHHNLSNQEILSNGVGSSQPQLYNPTSGDNAPGNNFNNINPRTTAQYSSQVSQNLPHTLNTNPRLANNSLGQSQYDHSSNAQQNNFQVPQMQVTDQQVQSGIFHDIQEDNIDELIGFGVTDSFYFSQQLFSLPNFLFSDESNKSNNTNDEQNLISNKINNNRTPATPVNSTTNDVNDNDTISANANNHNNNENNKNDVNSSRF